MEGRRIIGMTLEIADDGELLIKNGIYHFDLRDYPQIQGWEWNNILAFLLPKVHYLTQKGLRKISGNPRLFNCRDESAAFDFLQEN